MRIELKAALARLAWNDDWEALIIYFREARDSLYKQLACVDASDVVSVSRLQGKISLLNELVQLETKVRENNNE